MRKRDFTGERFGMLVAIKPLPKKKVCATDRAGCAAAIVATQLNCTVTI